VVQDTGLSSSGVLTASIDGKVLWDIATAYGNLPPIWIWFTISSTASSASQTQYDVTFTSGALRVLQDAAGEIGVDFTYGVVVQGTVPQGARHQLAFIMEHHDNSYLQAKVQLAGGVLISGSMRAWSWSDTNDDDVQPFPVNNITGQVVYPRTCLNSTDGCFTAPYPYYVEVQANPSSSEPATFGISLTRVVTQPPPVCPKLICGLTGTAKGAMVGSTILGLTVGAGLTYLALRLKARGATSFTSVD